MKQFYQLPFSGGPKYAWALLWVWLICSSHQSFGQTTSPIRGVAIGSRNVVQGNNQGSVTLADYAGSIQGWQKSEDGGVMWANLGEAGAATISYVNLISTTWYRAIITSNGITVFSEPAVIAIDKLHYVETKTFNNSPTNPVGQTRTYFNGLGQEVQSLARDITRGHVLATQPLYDRFGTAIGSTLPAPVGTGDFKYLPRFITADNGQAYNYLKFDTPQLVNNPAAVDKTQENTLGWYYSENNTMETHVPQTSFPYSRAEISYDGSSYVKQAGVGDELRMGKGHEAESISLPVINELNHYLAVRNHYFATEMGAQPVSLANNALQQITVDENGKNAVVIADRNGNTLLTAQAGNTFSVQNSVSVTGSNPYHYFNLFSAQAISVTGSAYEVENTLTGQKYINTVPASLPKGYYKLTATSSNPVTATYSNAYDNISYYFYNQLGQLVGSLAPEGVAKIYNAPTAYASKKELPFLTFYEYDAQGRQVAASDPDARLLEVTNNDAGKVKNVYRKDGALRFSQNAEQRLTGKYTYLNYDAIGRLLETGEYTPGSYSSGTNAPFTEYTAAGFSTSAMASLLETVNNSSAEAHAGGLADAGKSNRTEYFYDLPDNDPILTALGVNYTQEFTHGALSYTQKGNESKTWNSYDEQGRVAFTVQKIPVLGAKTINYTYDGLGNVSLIAYQQGLTDAFYHHYTYDADQRLTQVHTSRNGSTKTVQATYVYYLHGPLKRVELADKLQGIDYAYTVQGWLKSINHADKTKDPGQDGIGGSPFAPDAFGLTLEYFTGDYTSKQLTSGNLAVSGVSNFTPLYNGSIAAMGWRNQKTTGQPDGSGMYAYVYDQKYQLKDAISGSPAYGTGTAFTATNAFNESGMAYSLNGNMTTINRPGSSFTYDYSKPGSATDVVNNRLKQVNGYASYEYNKLGQLTRQTSLNTNLANSQQMEYDVQGNVTQIKDLAGNLKVKFTYDERGYRLRKEDYNGAGKTTYYVRDGAGAEMGIYEGPLAGTSPANYPLTELPLYGAGRLGVYYPTAGTGRYDYELSDHLGNVRAVVAREKEGSLAKLNSWRTYYPYGSEIASGVSTQYRYGYQGQFSEQDPETRYNSFELRQYDSKIGRWLSFDPYEQYHSPYMAMGNDPINSVDANGGWSAHSTGLAVGAAAALYTGFKSAQNQQRTRGSVDVGRVLWQSAAAFAVGYGAGYGAHSGISALSNSYSNPVPNPGKAFATSPLWMNASNATGPMMASMSPSPGHGMGIPKRSDYDTGGWGDFRFGLDKAMFEFGLFPGVGAISMGPYLMNGAIRASQSSSTLSSATTRLIAKLRLYPRVIDPRTGRHIPLPTVGKLLDKKLRIIWNSAARTKFKKQWELNGFPEPKGGWDKYDIHHIIPQEYGGTNDFWNLVPVEKETHKLFNNFWLYFGRL